MATKIKSVDDLLTADQETNIQQQARNAYTPSYNASVLATNQSFENQKTAAENAITDYETSAEKSKKEAVQTVTDTSVKRGMGRASRTDYEMADALGDIADKVLSYRKQVESQILSLTQQKDASLAQLSADYETGVLNQAASLRAQAIQNAQWVAEFNAAQSGGSGGGSSGLGGIVDLTGTNAGVSTTPNGPGTGLYNGVMYSGGSPYSGSLGNSYYDKGEKVRTGLYNGVLFSNGKPYTGSFGGDTYVNGKKKAKGGQFSGFNYAY